MSNDYNPTISSTTSNSFINYDKNILSKQIQRQYIEQLESKIQQLTKEQ